MDQVLYKDKRIEQQKIGDKTEEFTVIEEKTIADLDQEYESFEMEDLKQTVPVRDGFRIAFSNMFSNSKVYDRVMTSKYVPTKKTYDRDELASFNARKKKNPRMDIKLHLFQQSAVDYLSKNPTYEKTSDTMQRILNSETDAQQKEIMDNEMLGFMGMNLSMSMLNYDYLAENGFQVANLMATFEKMQQYKNNPALSWYFDSLTVSRKAQFQAMYDAYECLIDCVKLTLLSHGMDPYLDDTDPKDLDADVTYGAEQEKTYKKAGEQLKVRTAEYKKSLEFLGKTFGYKKGGFLENFSMFRKKADKKRSQVLTQTELKEKYDKLTEADRKRLREKKTYTIKKVPKAVVDQRKAETKKLHVGDVGAALEKVMPDQYKAMSDILTKEDVPEVTTELVHSVGNKLLEQGHDVLEFNVGGSSFDQFQRHYNGIKGKSDLGESDIVERYGNQVGNNQKLREKSKDVQVTVNGQQVTRNKTRFTMPGPIWKGGALDVGDFSVAKTRRRIREFGAKYLTNIFTQWEADPNAVFHDIDIMLRGHSRGGVGVSQGAMALKYWVHEHYPAFEGYVKFHIIQHDPVPGGDNELAAKVSRNQYELFDHEQYQGVHDGSFKMDGDKMLPLGQEGSGTVVYSMLVQSDPIHKYLFDPQEVLNAKRLVLTPFTHDVGLDFAHADLTQDQEGEETKAHGMAYYNATDGKVYRNSGLDELPDGVYVMDEKQCMVRVDSMEQLKSILALTMPEDYQMIRQQRILRAAESVFANRSSQNMDYASINHKRNGELFTGIQAGVGMLSSSYRKAISNSINNLKKKLAAPAGTKKGREEVLAAYDAVITAASKYIKERSDRKFTEDGNERLALIKKLYKNMRDERGHFDALSENKLLNKNLTWDDLFDITPVVKTDEAIQLENGVMRTESKTGSHVTFSKSIGAKEAKAMEMTSRVSEMLGGEGIYQEVRHAKLSSGGQVTDGVIFEQTYNISLSQIKAEATKVTMTPEAEMQLAKIRVMDLILGVEDRMEHPDAGLKVSIKQSKDGSVKVVGIKAEMCQSQVANSKRNGKLNWEEEEYAQTLSKESKAFLKTLKESDLKAAGKWYNGAGNTDKGLELMLRLRNLKKIAGV